MFVTVFWPLLESVAFIVLKTKENLGRNTKKWVLAKDEDVMMLMRRRRIVNVKWSLGGCD